MTKEMKTMVIKTRHTTVSATWLWLLGALFSMALAACAPSAAADIPTASESQESAPADISPAPTPVDEADATLVYSRCIRDNGYPEFPDPIPGQGIMLRRDQGMSFNDPRYLAAQEACQDLRPPGMGGGGFAGDVEERMEMLLELAQCMRDNGVSEWPDPSPDGGPMTIGPGMGIDPSSPTFQAAAQVCLANLQGGAMFGGGGNQ